MTRNPARRWTRQQIDEAAERFEKWADELHLTDQPIEPLPLAEHIFKRPRRCLICAQWPVGWAMPRRLIHWHLQRMAREG